MPCTDFEGDEDAGDGDLDDRDEIVDLSVESSVDVVFSVDERL